MKKRRCRISLHTMRLENAAGSTSKKGCETTIIAPPPPTSNKLCYFSQAGFLPTVAVGAAVFAAGTGAFASGALSCA